MIVIKKALPMPAFPLGTDCPLARQLTQAGLLLPLPEGYWRVTTRETRGEGELAKTGDYIKLDSTGMPYPTEKAWFEANHTRTAEGMYLQTPLPRKAWHAPEPVCPEIRFLLEQKLLHWDPQQGFGAQLWGTWQTAAPDAVVVLDGVETGSTGEIRGVEFHFVAAEEFVLTYDIL